MNTLNTDNSWHESPTSAEDTMPRPRYLADNDRLLTRGLRGVLTLLVSCIETNRSLYQRGHTDQTQVRTLPTFTHLVANGEVALDSVPDQSSDLS